MHLYDETLDCYLANNLPPATMSAIDAHVSNCLLCAHALADMRSESAAWERRGFLGRLVHVEAPSPPDCTHANDGSGVPLTDAQAA